MPAWDPITRHNIFASVSARRGFHPIDNADDVREIEAVDSPSESLSVHEEGTGGGIYWVERVGVLNFGNYYFPHAFGSLWGRSILSGISRREIAPARVSLALTSRRERR